MARREYKRVNSNSVFDPNSLVMSQQTGREKKPKLENRYENNKLPSGITMLRLAPNMSIMEKVGKWMNELPWYLNEEGSLYRACYSARASESSSSSIGSSYDDTDYLIEHQLKMITQMVRVNYRNEPEQAVSPEDIFDFDFASKSVSPKG